MEEELSLAETQKEWHGTFKAYITGFVSSVLLTIASFLLVIARPFSTHIIVYTIIGLGLVQAILQLLFFLHVREGSKPRWEMVVFYFMVSILLIVIIGSLWIMYDLNDRVMLNMTMDMSK